jgi:CelD/BcsL family acetyltransferase involved in cellulose biosynthesis
MCGIINSFDAQGFSEHQPGEIILRHVVENCCERGLREFDLGVGEAQYKESWCPRSDRLFNSFLPLTAAGWAYTRVASLGSAAKRAVKQSNGLRNVAERLRRVPDET